MVLTAWRMDSSDADQRAPHQLSPNVPVSKEALVRLGVLSWALDVSGPPEANELLNSIRKERGYTYTDTITISPEKLENYEGKLKIFFKEHLHTDEEIRLILVSCLAWPLCLWPGPPASLLCLLTPQPHPLTPLLPASGGHWLL